MNQKSNLTRNRKYGLIRKELVGLYGEDTTKKIIARAEVHYAECAALCRNASEGERQHLDGTILPTAAIYKALQDIDPDHALQSSHQVMINMCEKAGAIAGKLMKLPGMRSVFMWLLPKMAVNMFGEACGFQFRDYEVSKRSLKMNMTVCPYCRYARILGCPELTPVFCDSDFATYGNLPGIKFERTQTLGTGGSCCDFRFTRV